MNTRTGIPNARLHNAVAISSAIFGNCSIFRALMDIIVYCKANWIPPYTYIHTLTLTLNLTPITLTYIGARNMER
jgi:hypothetical protein